MASGIQTVMGVAATLYVYNTGQHALGYVCAGIVLAEALLAILKGAQ